MRRLWIALGLVAIELLLLLRVLAQSGVVGLVLLLVGSAAAGLFALRMHAPRAIAGWRAGELDEKRDDLGAWHAVFGCVGGLLLIVPGVLSDVAGLLLLLPPTRALAVHGLRGYLRPLIGSSRVASGLSNLRAVFGGKPDDPRKTDERPNGHRRP